MLRGYRLPNYRLAFEDVAGRGWFQLQFGQAEFPRSEPHYARAHAPSDSDSQLIDSTVVSTRHQTQSLVTLRLDDCVQGRYGVLFEQLALGAVEHADDILRAKLQTVGEVCEASGQVVVRERDANPIDSFLQALDKQQVQFSSDGSPVFSSCSMLVDSDGGLVYVPYSNLIAHLQSEGTSDQKERFAAIIARQKDDWRSGKRSF